MSEDEKQRFFMKKHSKIIDFVKQIKLKPVCNHDFSDADGDYLGVAKGKMEDGTYYEAEKWQDTKAGIVCVNIFFPQLEDLSKAAKDKEQTEDKATNKIIDLPTASIQGEVTYIGFLPIGMVVREDWTDDLKEQQRYAQFLLDMGLIDYTGEYANLALRYLTDIEGHDLVETDIILFEEGEEVAITPLQFTPVQGETKKKKPKLTILK